MVRALPLRRPPAQADAGAELTLAGARQAATGALLEVERGVDPAAKKKAATGGNTLREIAEAHLRREESKPADKRLRTLDQRRDTLERLILPKLGKRPINQIKRSEIVALMDEVETTRGARMADEVLGVLRIVCDWHARRDDDFRSPIVRGMTLTKPQERIRNRVLSNGELVKVWKAADAMEGPFGHYVQFLLLTATRRNEAARMTYAEISGGDWLIPAARYKTKARSPSAVVGGGAGRPRQAAEVRRLRLRLQATARGR